MAEDLGSSWSIVKFTHDNTIEAVPTCWLEKDICFWPKYESQKLTRAIKNCDPPLSTWDKFRIVPFKSATYEDYAKARMKTKIAEETSDLNSGDEKRKRRPVVESSCEGSSSDDSEVVVPQKPAPAMPSFKLSKLESRNTGDGKSIQESQGTSKSSSSTIAVVDVGQTKCIHDDKLAKQILRKLNMIEFLLSDMKVEITNIKSQPLVENIEDPWGNFDLPIATNGDLEKFEEFLKDNMEISIKQLVKLGGETAEEFIKRSMKKLLLNEIQTQYSFLGQKQKKNFSELNLYLLIKNSVFKLLPQSTEKKIEDYFKTFLKRAPERLKHEKK